MTRSLRKKPKHLYPTVSCLPPSEQHAGMCRHRPQTEHYRAGPSGECADFYSLFSLACIRSSLTYVNACVSNATEAT